MSFRGRRSPVERLLSHTPKKLRTAHLKEGKHWLNVLQNLTQSKSLVRARLNAHGDQCNVRVWRFATALIPKRFSQNQKIRNPEKSLFLATSYVRRNTLWNMREIRECFLGECISKWCEILHKGWGRGIWPSNYAPAIYLDQWTSKLDVIIVNFTSFFNGQREERPKSAVFSARFAQLAEWDFEQLAFLMHSERVP